MTIRVFDIHERHDRTLHPTQQRVYNIDRDRIKLQIQYHPSCDEGDDDTKLEEHQNLVEIAILWTNDEFFGELIDDVIESLLIPHDDQIQDQGLEKL